MKIALNYDPVLGQITDDVGSIIGTWNGLERFEVKDDEKDIDSLVKLKNAGFEVDEIIELRRKGLI